VQIYNLSKSFTNIMTSQQHALRAFVKLGKLFREFCDFQAAPTTSKNNKNEWVLTLQEAVTKAELQNSWFTSENIVFSLTAWSELLKKDTLTSWLAAYPLTQNREKKVGLILAGNIPLVGFHDFLATLCTGNIALVKSSSKDSILLTFVAQFLIASDPYFASRIAFVSDQLKEFDAVIATGSSNTSRYFECYFGKKPNIIRKNRTSIAILTGKETSSQLAHLGVDIFSYYGLGCRNVSKLLVPKTYDFDAFFNGIFGFKDIINQAKYANNYDYNKAVYLMSEFAILDNGFLLLKEDSQHASPIATLFYEYYDSAMGLENYIDKNKSQLQCVVAQNGTPSEIPFGTSQTPALTEYADGIDTVEFLLKT